MALNLTPWSSGVYVASLNCYDLSNTLLPPGAEGPLAQQYKLGIFLKQERENDRYGSSL